MCIRDRFKGNVIANGQPVKIATSESLMTYLLENIQLGLSFPGTANRLSTRFCAPDIADRDFSRRILSVCFLNKTVVDDIGLCR